MANFKVIKVSLLMLLILSVHVSSLEALSYHGRKTMHKRINNSSLLRELGFDLSKMKPNKRRAMTDTDADADRVAPGGPDKMHHDSPPNRL